MMSHGVPQFGFSADQQIKPGLQLWLNQAANANINPNNLYAEGSSSGTNNLPEMVQLGSANLPMPPLQQSHNVLKEESASFLYSDHAQIKQSKPPPAPMSATALLQKAAQIGSTRTNINQSVFGAVSSSSSSSPSPSSSSRSELHRVFQNSRPNSTTVDQNGFTRDFLGMSGESTRPFLAQELAKFASMSSTMGLSQFSGNH